MCRGSSLIQSLFLGRYLQILGLVFYFQLAGRIIVVETKLTNSNFIKLPFYIVGAVCTMMNDICHDFQGWQNFHHIPLKLSRGSMSQLDLNLRLYRWFVGYQIFLSYIVQGQYDNTCKSYRAQYTLFSTQIVQGQYAVKSIFYYRSVNYFILQGQCIL